jgi:drug/metabolite transporter (DMT)-like permease
MILFLYVGTGLLAGIVCERWRAGWRILVAIAGVAAGILVNTWPDLHWNNGRVLETLLEGVFWYTLASILCFVGPFLIALYGRRLVRLIARWSRREA